MVGARPRARGPHARVRRRHLRLVQPDARPEGGRRLRRGGGRRLAVRGARVPRRPQPGHQHDPRQHEAGGPDLLGEPAPDDPGAGERRGPIGRRDLRLVGRGRRRSRGRAPDGGRPAASRRSRHRRRRRALEGARQPRARSPPPAPARRRHPGLDPAHRGGAPVGAGAEIDRVLVGAAPALLLRLQSGGGVSRLHVARRRPGGIGRAGQQGGVDPLVPAPRGRHPARRRGGALGPLRAHRSPPLVEGPRGRRRGRRQCDVAQYRPGRGHRGDERAVARGPRLRGAVHRGRAAPLGGEGATAHGAHADGRGALGQPHHLAGHDPHADSEVRRAVEVADEPSPARGAPRAHRRRGLRPADDRPPDPGGGSAP